MACKRIHKYPVLCRQARALIASIVYDYMQLQKVHMSCYWSTNM